MLLFDTTSIGAGSCFVMVTGDDGDGNDNCHSAKVKVFFIKSNAEAASIACISDTAAFLIISIRSAVVLLMVHIHHYECRFIKF